MIKSKKGWVAIIEMGLAIVILFSFFMLAFDNPLKQESKDYSSVGKEILFQVENNETLRENVFIVGGSGDVETVLREDIKNVDSSVNLSVCITEIDNLCSSESVPPKKEVRAYDFFVTKGPDFKKLKVFVWSEG